MSDQEYKLKLYGWICDSIETGGLSFPEVLNNCHGAFPGDVLSAGRKLVHDDRISSRVLAGWEDWVAHDLFTAVTSTDHDGRLEHPVDFEWHFARSAVEFLWRQVSALVGDTGGNVLCLGCPSMYFHPTFPARIGNLTICDKNISDGGQLCETRRLLRTDIALQEPGEFPCSIAVIDPPWYDEFYRLFVWYAASNLQLRGNLVVSFPPEGTRPSAIRDFEMLVQWSEECGLRLVSHWMGVLPYRTPLFELNALRSLGILRVPLAWRKGNCLVFAKHDTLSLPVRPVLSKLREWSEFAIKGIEIKVDCRATNGTGTLLVPLFKGGVAPSVSSRFPGREAANVVTSGNRFYYSPRPDIIAEELDAITTRLNSGGPDVCSVMCNSNCDIGLCTQHVQTLVHQEIDECKKYFGIIHET